MKLIFICLGIYCGGCVVAFLFFLLGRYPGLITRKIFWPVVFLWPALTLWPVYAIAKAILEWKTRKP